MIKAKYNSKNEIFIDRNPKYFDVILDYLRALNTSEIFETPKSNEAISALYREADFFMLYGLKALLVPFQSSSILNASQRIDLIKLTGFEIIDKWELIYRGSSHGFKASDFHLRCDGSSKTLTIVKSTESYIFGGYTEATWDSSAQTRPDFKAFVFSLVNLENKPLKVSVNNQNIAIHCNPKLGPSFGNSIYNNVQLNRPLSSSKNRNQVVYALSVADQSNINYNSVSSLDSSYLYLENKHILAGNETFQVEDIEVWKKVLF